MNDETPIDNAWSEDDAVEVIRTLAGLRGPLPPVLLGPQETFGYVDPRCAPLVARELNLSRADVHGVLTFYADLRTTPPGDLRVKICRVRPANPLAR